MKQYSLFSHRLLAAIRELDCVGPLDVLAVGVLVVAEVCAGVVVFDGVVVVVWDGFLVREAGTVYLCEVKIRI